MRGNEKRTQPRYFAVLSSLAVVVSVVSSSGASLVGRLLRGDVHTEVLDHGHGVRVDGHLLDVKSRDVRYKVHLALALLFLKLQRDSANGSSRDTLHEMRDESGDLVAHALRRNHGDLIADSLVRLEVQSQTTIVLLDNLARVVLYCFRSDTSLRVSKGGDGRR